MIALFSSHRQTGLKHSNLILFKLRLSLKSFWGAKVWNYLTEKSFDKSKAKAKEVICFYWAVEEKKVNSNLMNPICIEISSWLQNDSFGPERSVLCGHSWLEELIKKQIMFPGTLPLNVTFKLPVSEISEIDDHKSVGFTISLHSFLHTSYLSFFLHMQNFWRIRFTPKYIVNYCVLPCITVYYTINTQ